MRLLGSNGETLAVGPAMVEGGYPTGTDDGGGPFQGTLSFAAPTTRQPATLEVFEESMKDGSIVTSVRVPVVLLPASAGVVDPITLDSPIAEIGTMPLHIAFRGARGNEQLTARIRFAGFADPVAEASTTATNGFGVINLGFTSESAPPATDGPATLQILHADGTLAAEKRLRILGPNEVQYIKVGWFAGSDEIVLAQQAVGKTPRLAQAAIEELVQGPWEGNAAGFTTMLPTVEEIVNYPGRDASWGYRVRLIKVTITNGVATVNFGPELRAYGTSVVRAQQIRQQVEQTLRQFSSVKEVVIQINGDAGALPQ